MSQTQYTDPHNGGLNYFTAIPNLADEELNRDEFRLFGRIMRRCGANGGTFYENERTTFEAMGCGRTTFIKARQRLFDLKYIYWIKKPLEPKKNKGIAEPGVIGIHPDIWRRNIEAFAPPPPPEDPDEGPASGETQPPKAASEEQQDTGGPASGGMQAASGQQQPPPQAASSQQHKKNSSYKKNPVKKNTSKKNTSSADADGDPDAAASTDSYSESEDCPEPAAAGQPQDPPPGSAPPPAQKPTTEERAALRDHVAREIFKIDPADVTKGEQKMLTKIVTPLLEIFVSRIGQYHHDAAIKSVDRLVRESAKQRADPKWLTIAATFQRDYGAMMSQRKKAILAYIHGNMYTYEIAESEEMQPIVQDRAPSPVQSQEEHKPEINAYYLDEFCWRMAKKERERNLAPVSKDRTLVQTILDRLPEDPDGEEQVRNGLTYADLGTIAQEMQAQGWDPHRGIISQRSQQTAV